MSVSLERQLANILGYPGTMSAELLMERLGQAVAGAQTPPTPSSATPSAPTANAGAGSAATYSRSDHSHGPAFKAGSATIANAVTTVDVNHGLSGTPTTVIVTPRLGELLWVSARDGTKFTVTRVGVTGADTFDWLAVA